ncbi:hypothetical protein FB451DRAFT_1534833 [Mycena latifolia]|nr:hypothetical protein FB451DRAFT_1534833 [Mycena latifolia]
MSTFDRFAVLFVLLSFFAARTRATAVTLWQFGQGRLLSASVTLPLQALGTAPDGSATTYLYQALNPAVITTTDEAGVLTTETTGVPTPRTIIASASGWIEPFANNPLACSLINSDFGACVFGTSTANSGAPTPEYISTVNFKRGYSSTASTTSSSSDQNLPSRPAVGAIVGGTLGGVAVLAIAVVLFLLCRRQRIQQRKEDAFISGIAPVPFETSPQVEAGQSPTNTYTVTSPWSPRKSRGGWPRAVVQVQDNSSHGQTTTDSVVNAASLQRSMMQINDRLNRLEGEGSVRREEPPPSYGYTQM